MIKCLLIFLVPSQSSSMPLYPESVVNQGTCPQLFHYVHFRLIFESIKELGNASLILKQPIIPPTYIPHSIGNEFLIVVQRLTNRKKHIIVLISTLYRLTPNYQLMYPKVMLINPKWRTTKIFTWRKFTHKRFA